MSLKNVKNGCLMIIKLKSSKIDYENIQLYCDTESASKRVLNGLM